MFAAAVDDIRPIQSTLMHDYWKPPRCPACGGPRVATILYGLPAFDAQLQRDLDSERVVLGGCIVSDARPECEPRKSRSLYELRRPPVS
jgi:hypothetical protein